MGYTCKSGNISGANTSTPNSNPTPNNNTNNPNNTNYGKRCMYELQL